MKSCLTKREKGQGVGPPAGGVVNGAHHAEVDVAKLAIGKLQEIALMWVAAARHSRDRSSYADAA